MEIAGDRLTEQAVRERAYFIWEREGKPHGRDREHWALAEREIFTAGMPAAVAHAGAKSGNGAHGAEAQLVVKAGAAKADTPKAAPRKRAASTAKGAAKKGAGSARPKTRSK